MSQTEDTIKAGRKSGSGENKRGGAPAENKSAPAPVSKLDDPRYQKTLAAGKHYDPSVPNPFGNEPPDLGAPVTEEPDAAA